MSAEVTRETRLSKFLTTHIDAQASVKSQAEIARNAGMKQTNMLTMFKKGMAKMPIDWVEPLAKELNVDPKHLFRLALEQYYDMALIDRLAPHITDTVTDHEREIIAKIRELSGDTDPQLGRKLQEALEKALK